jgi:hypothetical protein
MHTLCQYNQDQEPCGAWSYVREREFKKGHDVFDGAPNDWSAERGATHTLDCGSGAGRGTRPARLLKTVLYVGVDEDADGQIVWEKWNVTLVNRRESHNSRALKSYLAAL